MEIIYSPHCARMYKKCSPEIKRLIQEKENIFRSNPFNPILKTHKLQGQLAGLLAFSIDRKHRVIFEFINSNSAMFHTIGTHDIYY